jgi:hypothetical protein
MCALRAHLGKMYTPGVKPGARKAPAADAKRAISRRRIFAETYFSAPCAPTP